MGVGVFRAGGSLQPMLGDGGSGPREPGQLGAEEEARSREPRKEGQSGSRSVKARHPACDHQTC